MACGKSLNLASPERPRAAQHRAPRLPKALPAGVLEPDDLTPAQIERKFAQAKARLRYQRAVTQ